MEVVAEEGNLAPAMRSSAWYGAAPLAKLKSGAGRMCQSLASWATSPK